MILHDFSSLIHRSIHNAVKNSNPTLKDGKYITEEFIPGVISKIFTDLIQLDMEHSTKYGDIIICLDDHSKKYWRNDFYPHYKEHRKGVRDESEVDYKEVFTYINELVQVLKDYSPWKVFEVKGAEADDTIAILAKKYASYEPILIQSPDKDMIQLHKYSSSIRQYSSLTNKWVTAEDKVSAEDWLLEHVCLGDAGDGVPRIVDHTEFSENFKIFLKSKQMENICSSKFNDLPTDKQDLLTAGYDCWNYNRKGEPTTLDIFVKPVFGIAKLQKEIAKAGSLEQYLATNPLLKKHYERNAVLVLEENIPQNIVEDTIIAFNEAKISYNKAELEKYLRRFRLTDVIYGLSNLTKYSQNTEELTAENCGWL